MDRLEAKRQNSLEAVSELIILLERCREFNWASRFYPVKDALLEYEYEKAIINYRKIPMPNMGGFLDLILCIENGHTVRDLEKDNNTLLRIGSSLSETVGNLEIYLNKQIDKNEVVIPNGK